MVLSLAFLTLSAFAGLSAAEPAYNQSAEYDSGAFGLSPTQQFVAATDYKPVQLNYQLPLNDSTAGLISSGLLFFSPQGGDVEQAGPLIIKQDGTVVWSGAEYAAPSFHIEEYKGEDHIILWKGDFQVGGFGYGNWLVLNNKYEVVANYTTVGLLNDTLSDLHDSHIYEGDLATMTAYLPQPYDLSPYGGPSDGFIASAVVQEINITTNEVLFNWDSIDHVDPADCYFDLPAGAGANYSTPWDYFHINAIDKDEAGNYLLSSRYCHTLFYVDGFSGDIIWRLGGKNSSFTMGEGTDFSWQHDCRWRSNNTISLFDNAGREEEEDAAYSRGLLFNVDFTAMTGNVQFLENGNVVIGWGQQPYFQEFDSDGNALWEMHFGVGDVEAYRAFRFEWVGLPSTSPSLAIVNGTAYAWWNGATELASWELRGSSGSGEDVSLVTTPRTDFETAIEFDGWDGYTSYTVVALDGEGQTLGTSEAVTA
ncbi:ASST-domain-containing protein [Schizophyllum amplum]|uniref:ASST-domain-containing protein n=1 Tax=Schizophyllum amplum TaxID=97359 RepID=A0A550BZ21_9AGAR|nr:ASST-domain-containing protein [Auriculariopsis ampla]